MDPTTAATVPGLLYKLHTTHHPQILNPGLLVRLTPTRVTPYDRFELRKDTEAPFVDFKRPDGKVMSLFPAVKNREGSAINNHDHWVRVETGREGRGGWEGRHPLWKGARGAGEASHPASSVGDLGLLCNRMLLWDQQHLSAGYRSPVGSSCILATSVYAQGGGLMWRHLCMQWSGCQIYGSTAARNRVLRSGKDGKLKLNKDGSYLPLDEEGVELVG